MSQASRTCSSFLVFCGVIAVCTAAGCSPGPGSRTPNAEKPSALNTDAVQSDAVQSDAAQADPAPLIREPVEPVPASTDETIAEIATEENAKVDPPSPVTEPLRFARKALSESYAAKAEIGEISEVTIKRSEGLGHAFIVKGSKQNATMTLLSITPSGDPSGTLFLDDGRQIPLFIPVVENVYKTDLGL